ncbi:lysylphosphatidylglycerol synthase domain-containing protein [Thiohalobacter thiocyanaticus]|uniref:Flippase-like domain-containing protein n=1 Tax=Thiohalobacter thiocyanaticus TaxID=585455 RepID=A0A426QLB0_9GAMM|nr:lysylphosphatidylglycerol synthase domain-containing protein [Thiohalobacter thiocyanaticus]RRQ22529.1 hypothetical protein D6C00_11670 [Thiohalobacter thiocyanaticus]
MPGRIHKKRLLSVSVLTLFLAFAATHLTYHLPELNKVTHIAAPFFAAMAFISLVTFFLLGQAQRIIFGIFNTKVGRVESFSLAISNNFLNYLPAKAGLVARGAYFRALHAMPVQRYVAATAYGQLLYVTLAGFLGGGLGILIYLQDAYPNSLWVITVALIITGLSASVILGFAPRASTWIRKTAIRNRLQYFSTSLAPWRNFKPMAVYMALIFVILNLMATRLWLSFYLTDVRISAQEVLFLQTAAAASVAFSFLPGNLGLREGVIVGIGHVLGLPLDLTVTAAVLDRLSALVVTFSLGPWLAHQLSRKMVRQQSTSPRGYDPKG